MSRNDDESQHAVELDDVTVVKATEKALLIRTSDGTEAWIAKSLIMEGSEVAEEGDVGVIVLPNWLVDRESLG